MKRIAAPQGGATALEGRKIVPRARARGIDWLIFSPAGAEDASFPEVTWIVSDVVLVQKGDQFFLKRNLSVMLLLVGDVLTHSFCIRVADTERRITRLPAKLRM